MRLRVILLPFPRLVLVRDASLKKAMVFAAVNLDVTMSASAHAACRVSRLSPVPTGRMNAEVIGRCSGRLLRCSPSASSCQESKAGLLLLYLHHVMCCSRPWVRSAIEWAASFAPHHHRSSASTRRWRELGNGSEWILVAPPIAFLAAPSTCPFGQF